MFSSHFRFRLTKLIDKRAHISNYIKIDWVGGGEEYSENAIQQLIEGGQSTDCEPCQHSYRYFYRLHLVEEYLIIWDSINPSHNTTTNSRGSQASQLSLAINSLPRTRDKFVYSRRDDKLGGSDWGHGNKYNDVMTVTLTTSHLNLYHSIVMIALGWTPHQVILVDFKSRDFERF